MYDETAGRKGRERTTTRKEARGRKAQARRKGWVVAWRYGDVRGRSGGKGVSRVPKERRALGDCVRQLFTTISLNRPRLLPVSAAFVSRNLRDRRVSTYRDLGCSLSGLFSVACDETTPYPRPYVPAASSCAASCEVLRQRRVFTSLRSHNSGRQTGKPFFLPSILLFPFFLLLFLLLFRHRRRFPRVLHSSTFLAISVKYFKDRLPPSFRSLVRRLRFWG